MLHSAITIKKFRFVANIFAGIAIILFFIFSPVLRPASIGVKPQVKASYISEPTSPTSKGIPVPDITATSLFIMDTETGAVLADKNPHQRLSPASLTKIMTALVALDYYDEDTILKVINGQRAIGSTANLKKNDELVASDVLYGLLVPSGNDAAITIAENYPGGYKAFIDRMNSKAVDLGLINSHFTNVSGVENPNHFTSAYDISIIAASALKRHLFTNIVSTQKITLKSLKGYFYPLETTNKLLGKEGIFGVKTGWTPESGECLVTLAEREGHSVIIAVLNSKDRFGESETLVDWVYQNYSWQ